VQTTLVLPLDEVLAVLKMPESFMAVLDDKRFQPDGSQAIDLFIDSA
jgi:hypothetical protein